MRHDMSPKGTYRFRFDSLQEVQRYIENTPRTWNLRDSEDEGQRSQSWDLNAGYRGALKLARDGWREGAKSLHNGLVHLPAIDTVQDWHFDVAGQIPDVGRYCAGMPDNMIHYTDDPDNGSHPIITLCVPVNATANVKAQNMSNFGLAVARYVDELEAAGKRVELLACIVSLVSRVRVAHIWTVKRANEHMDLESVAFSLGHPAAFRRLGFALRERSPVPTDPSYGYSKDMCLDDVIDPTPGAIILNGMKDANNVADTQERALAHVRAQLDAALVDPEAASVVEEAKCAPGFTPFGSASRF